MKYILFTVVEADGNNGHLSQTDYEDEVPPISYEEEAICCFKALNKHLNDNIEIICFNPKINDIAEDTLTTFEELDVTYMHKHLPEADEHDCGWYNIPLVGKWLEEKCCGEDDILLHIDLDMIMVKPLPIDLLTPDKDCMAIVNGNTIETRPWDHCYNDVFIDVPNFVTCYISSRASSKFYSIWYSRLKQISKDFDKKKYWKEYCFLEEHSVDLLKYKDRHNIKCVDGFILEDDNKEVTLIDEIVFVHAHLYNGRTSLMNYYVTNWLKQHDK